MLVSRVTCRRDKRNCRWTPGRNSGSFWVQEVLFNCKTARWFRSCLRKRTPALRCPADHKVTVKINPDGVVVSCTCFGVFDVQQEFFLVRSFAKKKLKHVRRLRICRMCKRSNSLTSRNQHTFIFNQQSAAQVGNRRHIPLLC